jgi:peptide deformylase
VIRTDPDDVLRTVATPVAAHLYGGQALMIAAHLLHWQATTDAFGVAANQIGIPIAMFSMSTPDDGLPLVVCNPRIDPADVGTTVDFEGCLSLPGRSALVRRWNAVALTGNDPANGHPIHWMLVGVYARIAQHELDHLHGILMTDTVAGVPR